jgi:hypothetical protein
MIISEPSAKKVGGVPEPESEPEPEEGISDRSSVIRDLDI